KLNPRDGLAAFRAAEAEGKAKLAAMSKGERSAFYAKQFPPTYGPIITASQKTLNVVAELPRMEPLQRKPTDTLATLRLRQRLPGGVPAFPDDQAFDYYMVFSRDASDEPVRDWFARCFTMECLTRELLNEYWMDDAPYRQGYA